MFYGLSFFVKKNKFSFSIHRFGPKRGWTASVWSFAVAARRQRSSFLRIFFFLFFSLRLSLLFTSPRARRAPADTADKKANTQVAHQTDERTWDCHPLRDGAISFFFAAAAAAAAAAVGFLFFITEP